MLQVQRTCIETAASDNGPRKKKARTSMERQTQTVHAVAEASSGSRANAGTLAEPATATILVASRARWSRTPDRVLGTTHAATNEPTPTTNRPNAIAEDQTSQSEPTTNSPEPDKNQPPPRATPDPRIQRQALATPSGWRRGTSAVPAC